MIALALLAGLGVGLAVGMWHADREKDKVLGRLQELTQQAVGPVRDAVTETVRATVAAVLVPFQTPAAVQTEEPGQEMFADLEADERVPDWMREEEKQLA